ncbi:MAG: YARHG domain-containing protein, partial [Myxococcota bacterium]
ENDLLHDVFGAPGPLDHYLGPKDAQSLRLLSTKTLRHLRNGVYARHGRRFRDAELQNYFAAQAWYRENPEYTDALLNRMDRHNLKLIRFEESQR